MRPRRYIRPETPKAEALFRRPLWREQIADSAYRAILDLLHTLFPAGPVVRYA
ncbi:hypothetical protein [Fimbriimonas ginsengisoli]|uniref:hypothetical protein n=1 Tax=Fimbriimonas ginsengisoli TaxID=1005039 RepID=UPI00130EFC9B|nr:hypothetical protein [Fimbriimonas ginsengisoli]